jgi:single-stranded-DNA-specific exonuclease
MPVSGTAIRAVGWGLAERASALGLARDSLVDLAYRIRENDHPDFGGLEVEIAGLRLPEEDSD